MLYSAKHNFVYIKTQKTASTTAECALEYLIREKMHPGPTNSIIYPDGSRIGYRGNNAEDDPSYGSSSFSGNHWSAERIEKLIGPEIFKNSIKVSSIRNPYSACISAFHHSRKEPIKKHESLKLEGNNNFTKARFENFILRRSEKPAGFFDRQFCIQGSFIIDLLIRQEFFCEDLRIALEKINIPSETSEYILNNFSSMKVSSHKDTILGLNDYYSDKLINLVNSMYANWFLWGGYRKVSKLEDL